MTLAAGTRLGPYEIIAPLGAGGMGEVYRARDPKLDREVAVKVLPDDLSADAERRRRFQHEARVLATLNHPNVASIYGLEDTTDRMALIMELVDGVPLSERVGAHGLPLYRALTIATQIAAGLEAAHKVGVVHRDLKPANVLVTPSGVVKLVDFGIAKLVEEGALSAAETRTVAASPMTEAGQILGTVAYMSPEQARGEAIDARSDLFSFGTVLYEMLTGRRPFDGKDKISTLVAILHHEPAPPSEISAAPLPREVERIVLRCLRKDRDRRSQTASDLKLALEDLKDDTAATRLEPGPAAAFTRRRGGVLWLLIALCVGAIGAAYYFRTSRVGGRPPALRQLTFEAGIAITPALSPDGKLLAYASDRSGEGQLDIWLKQVAGGEPVRLTTGPDSKANPQFSPDGTRIYFLGGRSELYEVPALGGTSRKLIDSAGPFSVSSRGEIAFHRPGTGTAPGPIFVLPAGAASIEPWHPECLSAGAPIWSPDGLRVIFVGGCRPVAEGDPRVGEVLMAPRTSGTISRIGTVHVQFTAPRLTWVRLSNGTDALLIPQRSGDSINLHRLALDGALAQVTQGTGLENWPAVSPSGDLIFTRTEQTPVVWSIGLPGDGQTPIKEATPARMFGTSPDGNNLVFGRMLGAERGQLVLRDRARGTERVLASHSVTFEGTGSFWPQVSPDGTRIVYRVQTAGPSTYLISVDGGAPRLLSASKEFSLASDWSRNGTRVIGECLPVQRGICELLPDSDIARPLLSDPRGGQLLYPSLAWDGRWMAFMRRRSGQTVIVATPVRDDGSVAGEDRWVPLSPEDADAARPRFSPDGENLFYLLTRGSIVTLVRQRLDPASKRPLGEPVRLATVQNIPQGVFYIGLQNVVTVTRDRVFFNTAEIRSNVWMTRIE